MNMVYLPVYLGCLLFLSSRVFFLSLQHQYPVQVLLDLCNISLGERLL